ncbi:MAG: hypothetical protein GXO49_01010 [Chlorobi bacterium]|nr:hypothetical protein [Chlorobiota bacterium]
MRELISRIYESLFYNSGYKLIFDSLYDEGGIMNGYNTMLLIFLITPIVVFSYFYFIYKKPLATFMTWMYWLIGNFILVFGITYFVIRQRLFSTTNNELLNAYTDVTTGYASYANQFLIYVSLYNALLSLIVAFLFSIIAKHFSKQFIHLPF